MAQGTNTNKLAVFLLVTIIRNLNRNLGISRAPLKSQVHQLIHERCDELKGLSKE